MSHSIKLLRTFLREEIARNLRRGERVDHYPWISEESRITIIFDIQNDQYLTTVENLSTGETETKGLPSEEEAKHWARTISDKIQRDNFS